VFECRCLSKATSNVVLKYLSVRTTNNVIHFVNTLIVITEYKNSDEHPIHQSWLSSNQITLQLFHADLVDECLSQMVSPNGDMSQYIAQFHSLLSSQESLLLLPLNTNEHLMQQRVWLANKRTTVNLSISLHLKLQFLQRTLDFLYKCLPK